MDSSLKQRLIGAAVLVALAVIFLPMLVQGPAPDDGAGDVSLTIPEQPAGTMETREMPLQLPAPSPVEPAAVAGTGDEVVTIDADAAARPDALAGNEPPMQEGTAAEPAPTSAPADGPVATSPTPTAATETPAPAPPPPAGKSPAPAPAPSPKPDVAVAAGAGDYAINIGTYGNLDNAKTLYEQLHKAGLPATREAVTLAGKPAARLRLGPYTRRADAEADRLKVLQVRADLQPVVVALDATEPGTAVAAETAATGKVGFAVQVGAFRTKGDAEKLVETVRKAGFTAFSESVRTDSGTLYRVRVGPEISRSDADKLRGALATKLKLDGIVVAHP